MVGIIGGIMKIVISLGGSIVASPVPNVNFIKELSNTIKELSEKHDFFLVVGGGQAARTYIEAARGLDKDDFFCDELGIMATRMNAKILMAGLGGDAYPHIPLEISQVPVDKGTVVMGGTVPGHTTDAVSAMVAVHVGADLLINATNVDGIYSADPRKDPGAYKFETITPQELMNIVGTVHTAGMSAVIDPKAAGIIHKERVPTVVIDGRSVDTIKRAIAGDAIGTRIIVQ